MKSILPHYLMALFPVLVLGSTRQGYEELERQLKEVFKERSSILRQLSKTSKELEGIKVNLQSLKNDEASAKSDVQKLLELGQKQREEMKSLQEAFQKQLNEAAEKAEKQQATINFLKTEMERKSKMIRDLQNENKSLKNKLLSGSKLCGIHAEESKKIQAQLKELRYGKKDLIFKQRAPADKETPQVSSRRVYNNQSTWDCTSQDNGKICLGSRNNSTSPQLKVVETDHDLQKSHSPPWMKTEMKRTAERKESNPEELAKIKEKTL
ncbi:leucine zipper protein 2 isoform X4 [Pogona vitticeps]|uniref:Leucine zipper protein 2 isoform X4 n=1 Tax=Pogona vitticeps TaxID=103695 RepID=A0ABM5F993_9SAUR